MWKRFALALVAMLLAALALASEPALGQPAPQGDVTEPRAAEAG